MSHTISITIDIDVEVEGEYLEPISGSWEDPPIPARFAVKSVKLGDVYITKYLNEDTLQDIKDECIEREEDRKYEPTNE